MAVCSARFVYWKSWTLFSFIIIKRIIIGGFKSAAGIRFELNLPMLKSIWNETVWVFEKLTIDALRLQKVKLGECLWFYSRAVDIVHAKLIEKLNIWSVDLCIVRNLKNLKNLKYLCCEHCSVIDSTLLADLDKLKEVHLNDNRI